MLILYLKANYFVWVTEGHPTCLLICLSSYVDVVAQEVMYHSFRAKYNVACTCKYLRVLSKVSAMKYMAAKSTLYSTGKGPDLEFLNDLFIEVPKFAFN